MSATETLLKTSDFTFDLPRELIAQTPLPKRDASRLMLLDRHSGERKHKRFTDLPDMLSPGDCLVLNDSRVLPARLHGTTGTGAAAEVLLLRDEGQGVWACLTKPGKKTRLGTRLTFGEGSPEGALEGRVEEERADGVRAVRFSSEGKFEFPQLLERLGEMPLPPYIVKRLDDPGRYQTVYANQPGSAAAPTAGLHFTRELLCRLRDKGIQIAYITLHVGLGTFRPVKSELLSEHRMHAEYASIPADSAAAVNGARDGGGRVIAVGTTVCRTLESFSDDGGRLSERAGYTDIFITPGYRFRAMDALLTNFHLPRSTLLMLVSAFAGRDRILDAYREAVEMKYRFFSFGDAMLII